MSSGRPDFSAQFFSHADEDDRLYFGDPIEVSFFWPDPGGAWARLGVGLAAGAALMAITSFAFGLGLGYALGERMGRSQS